MEEMAGSTICHILNLCRWKMWLYQALGEGKRAQNVKRSVRWPQEEPKSMARHWASSTSVAQGKAAAVGAKAFGFSKIFYDSHLQDGIERSLGVQRICNLQDLL
ncbi:C-terminal-binding protein 2 [Fukomys damarensis]|uniref:C-terminal-binding protein 2 n=1 Tax=Fukomys damarensis TaxID=885580 RepID=A0A091DX40_FUKDA|nr:C-terminal-binding protein 2 [Fukomys damarensis]